MTTELLSGVPAATEFTAELVVRSRRDAADGVVHLELAAPDGSDLPAWEPGAHIDLILDDDLVRQYSLCGDALDSSTWSIAVLRTTDSRGGSDAVHGRLHEGATVRVAGPRNHFAVVESPEYLFVAGGIGITPIMPMIERAELAGANWHLYYLGRSNSSMAFADDLAEKYGDRVTLWADDARGGPIDLSTIVGEPDADTLIYSCGPEPLLDALEERCLGWPAGALHIERFAPRTPAPDAATEGLATFEVECCRSGIVVTVEEDQPLLEALEDADIPIMSSCLEGMCGTCQATVLDGVPDHQDSMLSPAERDSGSVILTCVSR